MGIRGTRGKSYVRAEQCPGASEKGTHKPSGVFSFFSSSELLTEPKSSSPQKIRSHLHTRRPFLCQGKQSLLFFSIKLSLTYTRSAWRLTIFHSKKSLCVSYINDLPAQLQHDGTKQINSHLESLIVTSKRYFSVSLLCFDVSCC